MRPRPLFVLLAVMAAVQLPTASLAQAQGTTERALALGHEGKVLFEKGDSKAAYEKFEKADALTHSPVFVLYMARCKRGLSDWITARDLLERLTKEPIPEGAPDVWRKSLADAAAELSDLRSKMPQVVITVRGAQAGSFTVLLDDHATRAGAVIDLNPGRHVASATRAGRARVDKPFQVDERSRPLRIEIDLSSAAASTSTPPPLDTAPRKGSIVPGIVGIVLGGLGIGAGANFGIVAKNKESEAIKGCQPAGGGTFNCPRENRDDADSAKTFATASTVSFVAGGVLGAAGAVLLIVRPGGGGPAKVGVAPGPGSLRVVGQF
jgi:hypothetical protein